MKQEAIHLPSRRSHRVRVHVFAEGAEREIGFVGLGHMGTAMAANLSQHGTSSHRLCPPTGSNGQACIGSVSDPQWNSANLFDCKVVISMLPDDAAVRDVVFGQEELTLKGLGVGIEARRNSSFHEHNQHIRCGFPCGGACPSRARLRRGAGLWKSGCRKGAPAVHCRRRRVIGC